MKARDVYEGPAAAAAFTAGLCAVAMAVAARGTVTLPYGSAWAAAGGMGGCSAGTSTPLGGAGPVDTLRAGLSVAAGPTMAGAAGWALAVVGLCWLAVRFPAVGGCLYDLCQAVAARFSRFLVLGCW